MNDVFARAGDETKKTDNDQDRQRPLHLGAVIARPKKREGNNPGGNSRAEGEPAKFAFVGKPVSTFWRPSH
jgi:hypothetical protein